MSTNLSDNNKRIAKNTLMLYVRMMFTMGVSLYTSRVVLNALGIEDYGIYTVVGGIISMISFINGGLISAIQRYITFEIGQNNIEKLKKVFTTSIQIILLISFIILPPFSKHIFILIIYLYKVNYKRKKSGRNTFPT